MDTQPLLLAAHQAPLDRTTVEFGALQHGVDVRHRAGGAEGTIVRAGFAQACFVSNPAKHVSGLEVQLGLDLEAFVPGGRTKTIVKVRPLVVRDGAPALSRTIGSSTLTLRDPFRDARVLTLDELLPRLIEGIPLLVQGREVRPFQGRRGDAWVYDLGACPLEGGVDVAFHHPTLLRRVERRLQAVLGSGEVAAFFWTPALDRREAAIEDDVAAYAAAMSTGPGQMRAWSIIGSLGLQMVDRAPAHGGQVCTLYACSRPLGPQDRRRLIEAEAVLFGPAALRTVVEVSLAGHISVVTEGYR